MPLELSTSQLARPNEHLAVLLPRHLWKPDALASYCDNFYCHVAFSLFERRHHCRKCGGVFCQACTAKSTPLLDTTNLDFVLPPRNVPISAFDSPESPVIHSRVCDDCYDQLHGQPCTPRTPQRPDYKRTLSHPISLFRYPLSPNPSNASSASNSDDESPSLSSSYSASSRLVPALSRKTRSLRTTPSVSSMNSTSSHIQQTSASQPPTRRSSIRALPAPFNIDLLEKSYGELDAYPLRRSSVLCKATGGGRWQPKHDTALVGYRPPGGKADYEIELEKEEAEERLRRANPIVKDGPFQYRFPPKYNPEQDWTRRTPMVSST